MGDLENQLIRLRSVAHDDLADALAMLPEMLTYPGMVAKEKQKDDLFKFLQKQTPMGRIRTQRTSKYLFGQKNLRSPIEASVGLVATEKGLGF